MSALVQIQYRIGQSDHHARLWDLSETSGLVVSRCQRLDQKNEHDAVAFSNTVERLKLESLHAKIPTTCCVGFGHYYFAMYSSRMFGHWKHKSYGRIFLLQLEFLQIW